ncbi:DUF1127 domain-containing protein [Microbaculum marinum]|uniref:DUF1127 domain-containing protein n=1 Tax=Microbaculum marinum TaxID=1764581 RepID=A0AAW9RVA3_9HYPH
MTTVPHFAPAGARIRQRRMSLVDRLARGWDVVCRWRRMRRAIAELSELDDRLLDDVGLSRSTLYARARERHGFSPSRW